VGSQTKTAENQAKKQPLETKGCFWNSFRHGAEAYPKRSALGLTLLEGRKPGWHPEGACAWFPAAFSDFDGQGRSVAPFCKKAPQKLFSLCSS
jgi:hypothetical protein